MTELKTRKLEEVWQQAIFASERSDPDTRTGFSQIEVEAISSHR
jgi:hypothetical protein